MSRPYVTATSNNKLHLFLSELDSRMKDFESLDGVLGITLNGGLSRGYADELSEIDLVFYLESSPYELWNSGQSPIPLGITRIGSYLYDIKISALEEEQQRSWESVALWDLSYAKILYDPAGHIARLTSEKLAHTPEPLHAEGLLFNCWWYFRLAGDIWIHRGDPVQGHSMLNMAAIRLLEALFIANREYVPHEKWLVHMSRTLPWTPACWETRLKEMMSTGDLSKESLIIRQAIIEHLWREVDSYIISKECPGYNLNVMHKTFYDLLKFLLPKDSLPIKEWTDRMGLSMLSREPFVRFTSVTKDQIIVDKHKLLPIQPEELDSWFAALVEQIKEESE